MNVRFSARATSEGSVAHQNEFGLIFGSRRTNVPDSTSASVSAVHSSSEPVHQCTRSGWVSSATSLTQELIPVCEVGVDLADVSSLVDVVSVVMAYLSLSR